VAKSLKIGQRVEGGKSKTADYDRGRVFQTDPKSKTAHVVWDSGVSTQVTFDSVEVIGSRGPKGQYKER